MHGSNLPLAPKTSRLSLHLPKPTPSKNHGTTLQNISSSLFILPVLILFNEDDIVTNYNKKTFVLAKANDFIFYYICSE